MAKKVPFTEQDVKAHIDRSIRFWRRQRDSDKDQRVRQIARYYVDAYQSMRVSLFGELLGNFWWEQYPVTPR